MNSPRLILPALAIVVAAVVAIVASTGGSTRKPPPAVPTGSAVSLQQTSLGKSLVDANGHTLYLFVPDKPNVSTLSVAGRAVWPPFTSPSTPSATGGATARIGRIAGAQVTYNGHPLYCYVGDHKAGQTLGQGLNEFGGRWYVLSAGGAPITPAPATSTSAPATSTPAPTTPAAPTGGAPSYGY